MIEPTLPGNEVSRLAALRSMLLLDTPRERALDRITDVAAQLFDVPISLISIVDAKRQWFKSSHGFKATETPRGISFCAHAILQPDILCVPDAQQDPRFADNPLVIGPPHIRFYAGTPIHAPGGEAIGSLCLIDSKPREFGRADRNLLAALGECVDQMLAIRQPWSVSDGRVWAPVLVTSLAAGLFEFFSSQLFFLPNPPAVLIACVVFAAFQGGIRAGLISAAIAWLYFAHFFSIPGQPFHYAGDNFLRVLVWAIATPAVATMTGILYRRSSHLAQIEKVNAILATHLANRVATTSELARLNEQIRLVTDNAPTHIAYYDEHWQCGYSNAPYRKWFGLSEQEITGRDIRAILGDAMYAVFDPFRHRVMAGEKVEYQGTRTHQDGSVRTVEVTLTPQLDEDGRFRSCYVFFNDISARVEAENALRRQKDTLEKIIETMGQCLVMFDAEGKFVRMNPATERLTGVSREKVIGSNINQAPWQLVHADGAPLSVGDLPFSRLRRGEERIEGLAVCLALPDGRRLSIIASSVALRDIDGAFVGAVTTYFDVTAHKAAEAELVRKSDELANLLETMAEGVIVFDREGRYLMVNAATERIFGAAREQIIGRLVEEAPWQRIHADGTVVPAEELPVARLQAGETRTATSDIDILTNSGQRRSVEINTVALVDDAGVFSGAIATVSDVTSRKSAEAAASRSQQRLERALDGARLALFEVEVQAGNVYLSEGWAEMIGAEPGETYTTVGALIELTHPEEQEELWRVALEVISGKRDGYDVEHRVKRGDGEWIWILSRCSVVERDAKGLVVRMAGTNVDFTERKRTEQRLHYLATRDTLTDLSNRALFGDELQLAIDTAAQHSNRLALIAIGLDRFTVINDSLGRQVGDNVLKAVAERITTTVGNESIVARPGGDEFLVLIPHIQGSPHELTGRAEIILAAIGQPILTEGRELTVTASIGIALFPDDADTVGLLLRNADIALHHAKEAGRDNLQFFAERMNVAARTRQEIDAAMRQGLARNEFVLHYQPQVAFVSGAVVGFEALVRWKHPERGLLPPSAFVPLAESMGLISALGEWVLEEACRQGAAWKHLTGTPLRIAVNVTASQFRRKGFIRRITEVLAATGLDPRHLELELTEDAIMEHGPEAVAALEAVRQLGIQLAIDDFGTGYSSLSYLNRLPIDRIKIDQSFIANLPDDVEAGAIVCAIIGLAHNLGLMALAEGVETSAQFTYLRDHGCDCGQGYFFGRPQPPSLITFGPVGNVIDLHHRSMQQIQH